MSRLACASMVVVLMLTAACSDGSNSDGSNSDADPPRGGSASEPTAPSYVGAQAEGKVADRCGPPDAPAQWITLPAEGKNRLSALVIGDGPVTAVYSHQTGLSGVCDFWPFVVWLAERHGIRSVVLDHCGVGRSACPDGDLSKDRVGQLQIAIDWARRHDARRLSLVGASLGGTTVTVAASEETVDAVVNLSGPVTWTGLNALRAAPRVTEPTLLALAPYDQVATLAQFRRLRSALGSPVTEYVRPQAGHGYEMLRAYGGVRYRPSPLAATVADWLQGDYGR